VCTKDRHAAQRELIENVTKQFDRFATSSHKAGLVASHRKKELKTLKKGLDPKVLYCIFVMFVLTYIYVVYTYNWFNQGD
jgi:hypothetical protein